MSSINEPIRIGTMLVKNRTVLPPMNSNYSNELGGVTPQMIEFYADRAKKGRGANGDGGTFRGAGAKEPWRSAMIYDEKYVPGWFNLTDRVHSYGVKISAELATMAQKERSGERYLLPMSAIM